MSKKLKSTIFIILGIALLFFGVLIASNIIIKNKIARFTKNQLPKNIIATFDDVSLHILNGTLTYKNVSVQLQNKSNDTIHTYLSADMVIVEGLSYWDYLTKEEIHSKGIKIKSPNIQYYKNKLITSKDTTRRTSLLTLNKPLLVDKLSIENAAVTFYDKSDKDTLLYVKDLTVNVANINVDNNTLKNRLPLNFGGYDAQADSIFLKVSPFENLTVGELVLKDKKAIVKRAYLATKFSRSEYTKLLQKERDHLQLSLEEFEINNSDFGFKNRKFFAKSSLITLNGIDAVIYRNKLLADDPTIKPLYSKMLRELPIDLTIDSVSITKGTITYQEKVKENQPPGTIYFDRFTAAINNVSNTYSGETNTSIAINTRFMKSAPLQADWSFDVNNPKDVFVFKANLGLLQADKMNTFTKPNLLVELEGEIEKTYFSIHGNSTQSNIDIRIDYKKFKINLLKKNDKQKNKLLSGILNIFIKKDSGDNENQFNEGSATVSRDRSKSFFNYVWVNVSAGLRECLL
jgi:hypothetical protein